MLWTVDTAAMRGDGTYTETYTDAAMRRLFASGIGEHGYGPDEFGGWLADLVRQGIAEPADPVRVRAYEPAALVQCVGFRFDGRAWIEDEEAGVEDMDGAEALKRIGAAFPAHLPAVDGWGEVCGYFEGDFYRVEFWDCDGCTYEDMYGEPYTF